MYVCMRAYVCVYLCICAHVRMRVYDQTCSFITICVACILVYLSMVCLGRYVLQIHKLFCEVHRHAQYQNVVGMDHSVSLVP